MKKIYHTNPKQKQAGISVLMSGKVDFKTRDNSRNKEGHFVIVIGSVHEGDMTILLRIVCI